MAEQTPEALQGQIAALEQQLAAKRAEGGADASAPLERAEVHEVVGEQIQQAMPSYQVPAAKPSSGASTPSWQDPALTESVQALVNVAFTKDLQQAIQQAVKTGNAALIDAFHDLLTDQLHEELLKRKKIDAAV